MFSQFLQKQDGGSDRVDSRYAVPHVITFTSLLQTWSRSYQFERSDEATRDSKQNAEAMQRDCWYRALISERSEMCVNQRWHVESEDKKNPVDQAVSEGVTRIIRRTPHLRQAFRTLDKSKNFGKYGLNCVWDWRTMDLPVPEFRPSWARNMPFRMQRYKALYLRDHGPIHGDKISYQWDGTPLLRINPTKAQSLPNSQVIITDGGHALRLTGEYRERVIIAKHSPTDADFFNAQQGGLIHGEGIRSVVYWVYRMRLDLIAFVADVLERVGAGIPIMPYDANSKTGQAEAIEHGKRLNRRSVIAMPVFGDGRGSPFVPQFLEAPPNGLTLLQSFILWLEAQIERYIVGQSMSAGGGSAGGLEGDGRKEFAMDTKLQKVEADCDELAEYLTGSAEEPGLVSVIAKYTYPWFRNHLRFVFDFKKQDPMSLIQAAQGLQQLGVSLIADEVREPTGFSKPTQDDEVIGPPPVTQGQEVGEDPNEGGLPEEAFEYQEMSE